MTLAVDGSVRLGYQSEGARVTVAHPTLPQPRVYDPSRVMIVRDPDDHWTVIIFGGGGRDHSRHTMLHTAQITAVSAWRHNMMQVLTADGYTISWSKSTICGTCGGLPAPRGYPWQEPITKVPFDPTLVNQP